MTMTGQRLRQRSRVIVYGTSPNGLCMDKDDQGGNPFATALIDQLQSGDLRLLPLLGRLQRRVADYTGQVQVPEWHPADFKGDWCMEWTEDSKRESRIALVLVVSDYRKANLESLPGAEYDQRRLSRALAFEGFSVRQRVNGSISSLTAALAEFGRESRRHDAAVIYCTGHGGMREGMTFLISGSHQGDSVREDPIPFSRYALPIPRIAAAAQARKHNVVFFGGCRTNL